jgi:hypothetical protein
MPCRPSYFHINDCLFQGLEYICIRHDKLDTSFIILDLAGRGEQWLGAS